MMSSSLTFCGAGPVHNQAPNPTVNTYDQPVTKAAYAGTNAVGKDIIYLKMASLRDQLYRFYHQT